MATKSLNEKTKSTWWPPSYPSWFPSKNKEKKETTRGPLGRPSQFNVEMTWWPPSALHVGKKNP
jgi:hypothetical protein